jgi:hypothetical protein
VVEVTLERVDVHGPEPAERSEPSVELPERLRSKAINPALGIHGAFNKSRITKYSQVLGDRGLRHSQLRFNIPH